MLQASFFPRIKNYMNASRKFGAILTSDRLETRGAADDFGWMRF